MAKKGHGNSGANDGPDLGAKLDAMTELLKDLFILQAMSLGANRDNIRGMLGVHPRRITKISKGMKRALKHGNEKA